MDEQEVKEILEKTGAVITESHIVYTSGKHGSNYVNKDAIYPYTEETEKLCKAIAERSCDSNAEVVIAPAVGGVILSQGVARHLTRILGRVFGIYAERGDKKDTIVIKRGYDKFVPGKRVLIVDDVLTTGGLVKKIVELVRNLKGEVVGVSVLCNRGNVQPADIGDVPKLEALINVQMAAYEEKGCPLCVQGIPINTNVGKGREWLKTPQGKAYAERIGQEIPK